jgi:6-pyruvoyltetrahydropterin/6-carboxytetrahydropterin synthase
MHFVTKTYGHECGLSACFRQHRATSHCRFLHGYPLSFKFTFAALVLDENGWVINFGGLKPLKAWLEETFDHKLLIAEDDPDRYWLEDLGQQRWSRAPESEDGYEPGHGPLAQPLVVPAVGCEAFATMAWQRAELLLEELGLAGRVTLTEVEVREHGANGVIYTGAN